MTHESQLDCDPEGCRPEIARVVGPVSQFPAAWLAWAVVVLGASGCTSPLTGLALKEFLKESTASVRADYEVDPEMDASGEIVAGGSESVTGDGSEGEDAVDPNPDGLAGGDEAVIEAADGPLAVEGRQLEESISRSLERFARAPKADATAQALLVETLETAERADWPEIIDSFSLSLENAASDMPAPAAAKTDPTGGGLTIPVDPIAASPERPDAGASRPQEPGQIDPEQVADRQMVASADSDSVAGAATKEPGSTEGPVPSDGPSPVRSPVFSQSASSDDDSERSESPESIVASLRKALSEARRRAPLVIANPCFASRVRGWAAVDRFAEYHFSPGQQVIVYLELENLVPEEDSAGAITRIDTAFRLVDRGGGLVQEWAFPTVEDHSASPRTDFFARYFLSMPESATAGPHRLEMVVTDQVAGKQATGSLELEIRPRGLAAAAE